jgi:hypothetical protein
MKKSLLALLAAAGAIAAVAWMIPVAHPGAAIAEEPALPGMCNGRSDANVVLNAHANGSRAAGVPKYILNLTSDEKGIPFGALILGQGKDRLYIDDWCRLWMHRPGDEPGHGGGQCEDGEAHDPDEEGAINVHAVGIGWHGGKQVVVRTDVRSGDEGIFFRARYREFGAHHEETLAAEEDGCEDDGWTRIPAEEWFPLDQLKVR